MMLKPALRPPMRAPLRSADSPREGVGGLASSLFGAGEQGFLFYPTLAAYLFQDTAGTTPVAAETDPVGRFNDQSGRSNNALQANNTQRPMFSSFGGFTCLTPDGVDDLLQTSVVPNASTAFTMALAFRPVLQNQVSMGGGNVVGNKRGYIGVDNNGYLNIGWGTVVSEGANDRRSTNLTVVVAGDALGRDVYVNGVLTTWGAVSGAPDGTGGGMAIGAMNNNGYPTNFAYTNIYAALSRISAARTTPAQVAQITAAFQRTYQ